ncbi:MAG: RHS repeat-associated core domain-containing protein, partial [Thermoanaerobaculia bacterium]|nr:RHS repeat-associated core domain-containing protein [Thermoanaerobaculia bacterium]
MGKPIQSQTKLISEQNVIAIQTIYDAFGRGVLQTLSAPINQNDFCFKNDFVTNSGGSNYNYTDFDIPNNSANPNTIRPGEVDNPKPVSGSNPGTLGWYYSVNNNVEPFVPASSFPYTRTEFDDNNGGAVKRASMAGEMLKSGSGHESYTFTMPAAGELRYLYGIVTGWEIEQVFEINDFPDFSEGHVVSNFQPEIKASKTIAADQNGVETVSFFDADGKLLATCLSGQENGVNIRVLHVMSIIKPGFAEQQYADIHLPQGCESSIVLTNSGNISPTAPIPAITYNIYDLKKGKYVDFGGTIDFTGTNPKLSPGFYRIVYKKGATLSELKVKYDVNYYNFSINYYDKAGRLKMSIPPAGVDLNYNPGITTISNSASKSFNYIAAPSGNGPDWSLGSTSSFNNQVGVAITLPVSPEVQITNIQVVLSRNTPVADYNATSTRSANDEYFSASLTTRAFDIGDAVGVPDPPPPPDGGSVLVYNYEITFDLKNQNGNNIASGLKLNGSHIYIIAGLAGVSSDFWRFNDSPESAVVYPLPSNTTAQVNVMVTHVEKTGYEVNGPNYGIFPLDADLNNLKLSIFTQTEKLPGIPAHSMPEVYDYNSLGWLLSTNTPDGGKTEFVYKKDGTIRFKQNAAQRAGHTSKTMRKFSYINYDAFNRIIETGEYDPALPGPPPGSEGTRTGNLYFENYYNYNPNIGNSVSNSKSIHQVVDDMRGIDPSRSTQRSYISYDFPDPDFYLKTTLPVSDYKQSFVWGRVAKTWNKDIVTWYSYNELGQLIWIVQRIENMPNGNLNYSVKTVNYTYDFNGNLLEIKYQKENSAETVEHYYTYDADKRLKKAEAKQGNNPREEQVSYSYYKHGPLKRVELANKMQGIDYVYTINGWLKSLNTPELNERDPGRDGAVNSPTPFPKDLFGMTLDYFAGDYLRPGTYVQTYDTPENYSFPPPAQPVTEKAKNLYNGLIKDQRWQIQSPAANSGLAYANGQLMYGYLYDRQYQLTEATFGAITSNGVLNKPPLPKGVLEPFGYYGPLFTATEDYKSSNIRYDRNGNIKSLTRNACISCPITAGLDMDRLVYHYTPQTNKLHKVSDAVSVHYYASLDFKPGQSNNNYIYNETGQLTADVNDGNFYEYNLSGNVTAVYGNANKSTVKARFVYDDRGFRLKKTNANGDETWYIHDADGNTLSIYEKPAGNALRQTEAGIYAGNRIGAFLVQANKTVYELTDHLGNVRTTFFKQPYYTPSTSFEGNGNDDYLFNFQAGTDNTQARTGARSVMVVFPAQQYGAGIKINVTPGQKISASVYSKYLSGNIAPNVMLVFSLDNAGGNLDWKSQRIGGAASAWNLLSFPTYTVTANAPGMWLSIYPWNADAGSIPVWFDDLSVTITPNNKGEGGFLKPAQHSLTDYYPHGGVMPGRAYAAANHYRYGYQGQYAEKDPETGFNSFELRMWDGRLGRWMSPDPYGQYYSPYLGMGNNPVNNTDPSGGYSPGWIPKDDGSYEWINDKNIGSTTATWLSADGHIAWYGNREGEIMGFASLNTVEVSAVGMGHAPTFKEMWDEIWWMGGQPDHAYDYCWTNEECNKGAYIIGGVVGAVILAPVIIEAAPALFAAGSTELS